MDTKGALLTVRTKQNLDTIHHRSSHCPIRVLVNRTTIYFTITNEIKTASCEVALLLQHKNVLCLGFRSYVLSGWVARRPNTIYVTQKHSTSIDVSFLGNITDLLHKAMDMCQKCAVLQPFILELNLNLILKSN